MISNISCCFLFRPGAPKLTWLYQKKIVGFKENVVFCKLTQCGKKYQNRTFKFNFRCQKLIEFFQKKNSSKNINLGDHYLLKTFFSKLNFWTTLLSKIKPNFWQTAITPRNFLKIFPWWHVDSWPKTLLFRTHHL